MTTRSARFDLFAPDADSRQSVLDSIRRYRHACRQCYAAFLTAQCAGATLINNDTLALKPDGDRAKLVLALALESAVIANGEKVKGEGRTYTLQVGSSGGYEMRSWFREHLYPASLSFVWDSARRDVLSVWTSGDPEHPKASRGWLAMQGARGSAMFQRRGIGFPAATGRPKLEKHSLTLKWDSEIGPVTFNLPRLFGGRYHAWRSLRDKAEGWELGTLYLSEQDGQIFATVTYSKPEQAADVDGTKPMSVGFDETNMENWLWLCGPDRGEADSISAAAAVAWLARAKHQTEKHLRIKAACGSPRQPWGQRTANAAETKRLNNLTLNRSRVCADWNHAWTRRIVTRAVHWRCGRITLPSCPEMLFGHPWPWAAFLDDLTYKSTEKGIVIA